MTNELLIEQSYALLADLSADGVSPKVLSTDDGRFEARAEALVTESGGMQEPLLAVSIGHDRGFTRLVLDYTGRLNAMATASSDAGADVLVRDDLHRKGLSVIVETEPLVADAVTGPKRTSVLHWGDDDELSVRVKRMDDDYRGSWLQIRAYLATAPGYVHPVLTHNGQLVCLVSGRTDQDAWQRVQGELSRQGVEFA